MVFVFRLLQQTPLLSLPGPARTRNPKIFLGGHPWPDKSGSSHRPGFGTIQVHQAYRAARPRSSSPQNVLWNPVGMVCRHLLELPFLTGNPHPHRRP
ncbi:hypothetical protein B0T17DRAFT_188444 [Bombardia bombarda]|uniref:Uncharacterized protein n=1 Tax=Bombardia bombarda TaxID=252184 RepID=A0AA40C8J2_9PEZI|nr:hypothetical protein B0T17DRAFT_188444 [Bombardia bombarda]